MPELPEVETVRRGLAMAMEGRRITQVIQRRADLRWPIPEDFVGRVTGRIVERLERRAKYLLFHLDDGTIILLHLGMSGRFLLTNPDLESFEKHDHVVFVTDEGTVVRFNDARRFGMVDLSTTDTIAEHPRLVEIGPEPLGNAFNGPALAAAIAGKRTPIKSALLDQKVVAGVGNIYACEALFRSNISPRRQAYTVKGERADKLATAIRQVLSEAIASGGSTLRDHVRPDGELGYFQHGFETYDREGEPCVREGCGATIKRLVQSGRSTFYCPKCQR